MTVDELLKLEDLLEDGPLYREVVKTLFQETELPNGVLAGIAGHVRERGAAWEIGRVETLLDKAPAQTLQIALERGWRELAGRALDKIKTFSADQIEAGKKAVSEGLLAPDQLWERAHINPQDRFELARFCLAQPGFRKESAKEFLQRIFSEKGEARLLSTALSFCEKNPELRAFFRSDLMRLCCELNSARSLTMFLEMYMDLEPEEREQYLPLYLQYARGISGDRELAKESILWLDENQDLLAKRPYAEVWPLLDSWIRSKDDYLLGFGLQMGYQLACKTQDPETRDAYLSSLMKSAASEIGREAHFPAYFLPMLIDGIADFNLEIFQSLLFLALKMKFPQRGELIDPIRQAYRELKSKNIQIPEKNLVELMQVSDSPDLYRSAALGLLQSPDSEVVGNTWIQIAKMEIEWTLPTLVLIGERLKTAILQKRLVGWRSVFAFVTLQKLIRERYATNDPNPRIEPQRQIELQQLHNISMDLLPLLEAGAKEEMPGEAG